MYVRTRPWNARYCNQQSLRRRNILIFFYNQVNACVVTWRPVSCTPNLVYEAFYLLFHVDMMFIRWYDAKICTASLYFAILESIGIASVQGGMAAF